MGKGKMAGTAQKEAYDSLPTVSFDCVRMRLDNYPETAAAASTHGNCAQTTQQTAMQSVDQGRDG